MILWLKQQYFRLQIKFLILFKPTVMVYIAKLDRVQL